MAILTSMTSNTFFQKLVQQFNLSKREIDLILCHVLDLNTAGLFVFDKQLTLQQQSQIIDFLQQREGGKPLAYITGIKSFWELDFKVNEYTLIPRPETELIVDLILQWTDADFSGNILDLGTGTGAIAISIANERRHCQVSAIDFSLDCIEVAKHNQNKHQITNINIFQSNWFGNILPTKFEFIVSNPPYITQDDPHLKMLSHEPISALTASKNGYSDLQLIIENAKEYLTKNGQLILEHGYNQYEHVQVLLKENGYFNIVTHNDIAGIPRTTTAKFLS